MNSATDNLEYWTNWYANTKEKNEFIHKEFTIRTNSIQFLKSHRDYIESEKLGFGDRAFHYLWYLLLKNLKKYNGYKPKTLEIGVYKGQVISLWSLIGNQINLPIDISAISPLSGNEPRSGIVYRFKSLFSKKFKKDIGSGNIYKQENYLRIIQELFQALDLNFSDVEMYKGLSNDAKIQTQLAESYDIIYIDGDHSFEGCLEDINYYTSLVRPRGFLVMDDAGCFLEGDGYWKGHKSVSLACNKIPEFGFSNILNVGHNRIYIKHA